MYKHWFPTRNLTGKRLGDIEYIQMQAMTNRRMNSPIYYYAPKTWPRTSISPTIYTNFITRRYDATLDICEPGL